MQWTDPAIVISTSKYSETSGIVSLLSREHGLFKGLVRGISSKKQCGIYQTGNLIEATWRGRLSEHLGSFTADLLTPNAALLLDSPIKLSALSSICAILDCTLSEREPSPAIFEHLKNLIEHLKNDQLWQIYYVLFELELLSHLGFRLDLQTCAATGVAENLIYISPKSGCAVSAEAGEPYKDKMLPLPEFLINPISGIKSDTDIKNGMGVCTYFFEKYIFSPHEKKMPGARVRFSQMVGF